MIALLLACGPRDPDARSVGDAVGWSTEVGNPLPPAGASARSWRRMDLDQLSASMTAVSGGISWTSRQDPSLDLWQDLHQSLGVPDYILVTQEDLATGVLFQKFLADAAAQVCDDLVARESAPGAAGNVFLVDAGIDTTDPVAIDLNLSRSLLRFHGRLVAPGDPALAPWSFLYESTLIASGDPAVAWRTVCVGLFVHPDFYGY